MNYETLKEHIKIIRDRRNDKHEETQKEKKHEKQYGNHKTYEAIQET